MKNKAGFSTLEMLLGVFFSSMVLMLIAMISLLLVNQSKNMEHFDQNRIGIIQLQNELTVAHGFYNVENEICYTKFENEFCLSFDNNRLVKRPGYEIYLINVTQGSIRYLNQEVLLSFTSKARIYDEIIRLIE